MNNSTLWNRCVPLRLAWIPVLLLFAISANAQVIRNYGIIYSNTLKGGHTMFGNTILARDAAAMNEFSIQSNGQTSSSGNDNANMQFVDVDGASLSPSIISFGDSWYYYRRSNNNNNSFNYDNSNWPTNYQTTGYSQSGSAWTNGSSPIRFGMGSGGTALSGSNGRAQDRTTYYFRKSVTISGNPANYSSVTLNVRYDDGVIVYVNGTEVGRANMPAGPVDYNTTASGCNGSSYASASFTVPVNLLTNGTNIIAAEVHQGSGCSSPADMYFDVELTGVTSQVNTFNSSSADLILPGGTNSIKFARLYWGGRINVNDANYANRQKVLIRKGTSGAYASVTAPGAQFDDVTISSSDSAYQAYIDVTNFIQSNGSGTYTVANVAATTGSVSGGGNYAGWAIVVVYENTALPYRSVRVYDGFLKVSDGATQNITLSGLNAPNNPLNASDAYMTSFAWEGDANLAATSGNPNGDYIKVNNNTLSNAVNPATNMWNGTISTSGAHVTTKNPDYKNQMGIDIDQLDCGTYIAPNSTDVAVEFGTESDQYFPSVFAFTMVAKDPTIYLDKTVSDNLAPFGNVQANEILTYTISGGNNGPGAANNCFIVDTLPAGLTYIPGSLEIVSSPGATPGFRTDTQDADIAYLGTFNGKQYIKFFIGNGATGSAGGTLAAGETYSVRFKMQTPNNANSLVTYNNTARISATDPGGNPIVDDGTAIIGPMGSPLAVKLGSFTVKKNGTMAELNWVTLSETKNDRFEIERSTDGVNFSKVGEVKGAGTTTSSTSYQFNDPIGSLSAGIIYYRLRDIDIDGKPSFSKIVALKLNGSLAVKDFSVYPNPFTSNIKVNINSTKETAMTIRISNASGQSLINRVVTLQPGENVVVIKDLDALKTGIHFMEIISDDGRIVQKLMKK